MSEIELLLRFHEEIKITVEQGFCQLMCGLPMQTTSLQRNYLIIEGKTINHCIEQWSNIFKEQHNEH